MDENYSIIPHGVNFQDPIFPDTPENHRMFASLFQFSNCTPGTQVHTYTPDWEIQEDNRVSNYICFRVVFRGIYDWFKQNFIQNSLPINKEANIIFFIVPCPSLRLRVCMHV